MEILAALAIVSILAVLVLTSMSSMKGQLNDAACIYNLRQLGMAALLFSNDLDGCLPDVQVQASDAAYPGLNRWPQWAQPHPVHPGG